MLMRCIRAEMRKLRGAGIWWVFALLPVISAAYGTFNFMQNREILTNGWYSLFTQHTLFYALFFFSPMVGVYAAYLWRMEHIGGGMNLLMTMPVQPFCFFAAKGAAVLAVTLLTQGWVFALYVLCGRAVCGLAGWPPVQIALYMLRGLLGALAVVALQLLLSMVIRSFAVPVLIALVGGVVGMALVAQDAGLCWPYALVLLGMNANRAQDQLAGGMGAYALSCLGFAALFCLLAQVLLTRRDVRA